MFELIRQDLKAYRNARGMIQWNEPSIFCVLFYRIGHAIRQIRFKPLRLFLTLIHYPFYFLCNVIVGIYIPWQTTIGGGLRIYHYGCICINSEVIIGSNCVMRHGVTIGVKKIGEKSPVIGNNVEFGAGAKVLGALKIGDNVTVGANAVVVCDVPTDSIAVGVPAKIYPKKHV